MDALSALPICVYVVDDDRDTTECLRLLLEIWGHQVHVANGGAEAIARAPQLNPHLMLVDLGMPQVDGLQVARRVRENPALAHTMLVAITGYGDPAHLEQAREAGFDECVIKPLPADDLQALLGRVRERIVQVRERCAASGESAGKNLEPAAGDRPAIETSPPVASDRVDVRIRKSGISELFYFADQASAQELRGWLRQRGCRVGPVFEPSAGQIAFFNYSRHQARRLLHESPQFRIID